MARVVYSQEELLAHKPPNVPFLVFFTLIWPLFTPLCACCTTERLAGMYSCLFFRFTHIIQRHLRLKWIHHAQCTYFPAESRSADLFVQWVREAAPGCPTASTGTSAPPAAHFLVRTANFGLNIFGKPSVFIHTLLPAFAWKNMLNLTSYTWLWLTHHYQGVLQWSLPFADYGGPHGSLLPSIPDPSRPRYQCSGPFTASSWCS